MVGLYLGVGIVLSVQGVNMAFYQFPILVCALIAIILAFIMFKGTIDQKFTQFLKGMGDENILIMCMVYLLAGAFSTVASSMGAVESTVNLGLSIIPASIITAGMFIISAFMATAMGTSMGTVSALMVIAVSLADKAGLNVVMMVGAVVGGAMFGDNLSIISDTTIAATRTQGVEMRDKFRMNGLIALPAAVLTVVLLLIFARPDTAITPDIGSYNIVKILPYLAVLIMAVVGVNVFVVLTGGIFLAGIIGLLTASPDAPFTILTFAEAIMNGFMGMAEIMILSMMMGGLAHLVTENGGIHWILNKFQNLIRSKVSAQAVIAALVSLVDAATANNTVAIIITGPIARDVCYEYEVDPRKSASLLDVFACIMQGIIPYGAQLLVASSLAMGYFNDLGAPMEISPPQIVPYLWYCLLLAVSGILSIFFPFADGVTRKRPWNFKEQRAMNPGEK